MECRMRKTATAVKSPLYIYIDGRKSPFRTQGESRENWVTCARNLYEANMICDGIIRYGWPCHTEEDGLFVALKKSDELINMLPLH